MRYAFLLLIWSLVTTSLAIGQGAQIQGTLMVQRTPVANATITLLKANIVQSTMHTGSDGKFQFTNLAAGTYRIALQAGGYTPDTLTIANLVAGVARNLGPVSLTPLPPTPVLAEIGTSSDESFGGDNFGFDDAEGDFDVSGQAPPTGYIAQPSTTATITAADATRGPGIAQFRGSGSTGNGRITNERAARSYAAPHPSNYPAQAGQRQQNHTNGLIVSQTEAIVRTDPTPSPGIDPNEATDTTGRPRVVPREPSNPFYSSQARPYTSFGADVDQASYTLSRRSVEEWNRLPDPGAVRVEEFLNYFPYNYTAPSREKLLAVYPEMTTCPWNPQHYVLRVGVRAAEVNLREAPAANLVFLIDVSGSMGTQDRLPLVKQAMLMLLDTLRPTDRVAIVTYSGASGVALASTPVSQRQKIRDAIQALGSGGSTAGAQGIMAAYQEAQTNFIRGGNNRVILCTDGDFNVGVSDQEGLKRLIEQKREEGVFLTTLGFGTGGYADQIMETLADNGNGFYAYVSNYEEAKRVFTQGLMGSLLTVAKDVKFQMAFNPEVIRGYRLIGYENRRLTYQEFNDDRRDAGDLGAGHYVTVLLELVPATEDNQTLDATPDTTIAASDMPRWAGQDWMTLRMRHKKPDADTSAYWCYNVASAPVPATNPTADTRWAVGVSWVAQLLRGAGEVRADSWADAIAYCERAVGNDPDTSRAQFITWAKKAATMAAQNPIGQAGR